MTTTIDYATWVSLGKSIPTELEWLKDKVAGYLTESGYKEEMEKNCTTTTAVVINAAKGPDSLLDSALLFDVRQVSPSGHYLVYYIKHSCFN